MKTLPFAIADALSALLSVPIVVGLGYFFAHNLERVRHRLHQVEWIGAVCIIGVGVVIYLVRRSRERL